jgi:nucleoside-diphosphate-sugar epimerase
MRLIVTGGAGFIGCTLTRRLIGQGHEVHVLDVKPEIECRIAELDHTSYHCLDIRSPRIEGLLNQLKPDGVIHLAAVSRVIWGEQYPEKCESVNVEGTMNLLKSSRNLCCPPWVAFSSSREVYGEPACLPVSEEAFLRPMNTYGFSKLNGKALHLRGRVQFCHTAPLERLRE